VACGEGMNSDLYRKAQDVPFKAAGVGHASTWKCDDCKQGKWSYLGRKRWYGTMWRCAECVAKKG